MLQCVDLAVVRSRCRPLEARTVLLASRIVPQRRLTSPCFRAETRSVGRGREADERGVRVLVGRESGSLRVETEPFLSSNSLNGDEAVVGRGNLFIASSLLHSLTRCRLCRHGAVCCTLLRHNRLPHSWVRYAAPSSSPRRTASSSSASDPSTIPLSPPADCVRGVLQQAEQARVQLHRGWHGQPFPRGSSVLDHRLDAERPFTGKSAPSQRLRPCVAAAETLLERGTGTSDR